MSAGAYMGSPEAQALIGQWVNLVGAATDNRGNYKVGSEVVLSPKPRQYQQAYQAPAYYQQPQAYYQAPAYQGYQGYQGYGDYYPHRHHHHHHHRHGWHGYPVYVQGWQNLVGKDAGGYIDGFPPRNLLVDAAEPQRAGREVLPMSVDTPILPGQSAQITSRPQRVAFRPERVFISAGPTGEGANAWLVNDIKIGNRSQFSQSGYIPGDMFATTAIDSFVSFETAQTAMDVVMVVTYVGSASDGQPFYGAIIGTAAV